MIHERWWNVTVIYFAMVLFWGLVTRMSTVTVLHGWLCRLFGVDRVGGLDRIKGICKRFKVKLAKRGRPRKVKPGRKRFKGTRTKRGRRPKVKLTGKRLRVKTAKPGRPRKKMGH